MQYLKGACHYCPVFVNVLNSFVWKLANVSLSAALSECVGDQLKGDEAACTDVCVIMCGCYR